MFNRFQYVTLHHPPRFEAHDVDVRDVVLLLLWDDNWCAWSLTIQDIPRQCTMIPVPRPSQLWQTNIVECVCMCLPKDNFLCNPGFGLNLLPAEHLVLRMLEAHCQKTKALWGQWIPLAADGVPCAENNFRVCAAQVYLASTMHKWAKGLEWVAKALHKGSFGEPQFWTIPMWICNMYMLLRIKQCI